MTKIGFLILFVSMLLLGSSSYAQTENSEAGWQLPPLQTLIDSAMKHSPMITGASYDVLMSQYELTDAHKAWMQRINISSDVRYGSMIDWSRLQGNNSTFMSFSDTKFTPTFGVGINAYLPISEIFDKKRSIQKAQLRIDQSENRKDEAAQTLKQSVINAYFEVMTTQKTLATRAEMSSSSGMLFDQAKLDYAENRITLSEYTRTSDEYLLSQNEVEIQKFNLLRTVRTLEVIVGIELIK